MTKATSRPPLAHEVPLSVPLYTIENVFGLTVAAARERHARLSRRERQIARLLAGGKPNRDIAAELNITTKTTDIHRANVKIKLEATTLAQIANVVNLARLAEAADEAAG